MLMGDSSQPHRPWVEAAAQHWWCPGAAGAGCGQQQRTGQAVPRVRFRSLTKRPKIV